MVRERMAVLVVRRMTLPVQSEALADHLRVAAGVVRRVHMEWEGQVVLAVP